LKIIGGPLTQQKLLALDLDGTLLDDDGNLHGDTIESLIRARKNDALICFVTGRCEFEVVQLQAYFPLADFVIINNGSKVMDIKMQTMLSQKFIPCDAARQIINFCLQNNFLLHIKAGLFWGANLVDDSVKHFALSVKRTPFIYESVIESLINQVDGFSITTESACQGVNEIISRQSLKLYIINSEPGYYDILRQDVSKWQAICLVAKEFNIPVENIITVGNYTNDIDMIRRAGTGIAVQNALEEVKNAADYVTTRTNNQNIVEEIIDHFINTDVCQ
jgi:Cof subfamily protein (haloacid dehalogenase superfamily)